MSSRHAAAIAAAEDTLLRLHHAKKSMTLRSAGEISGVDWYPKSLKGLAFLSMRSEFATTSQPQAVGVGGPGFAAAVTNARHELRNKLHQSANQ